MGTRVDVETGGAGLVGQPHQPPGWTPAVWAPVPQRKWFSWLIPVFFVVNVAMFARSLYINNCPATTTGDRCLFVSELGRFAFQPLSENPLYGPSARTLEQLGALDARLAVNGEGYRLFSCIWLHAGAIHLVANMLSLLFIGIHMEREFGFLRIGVLYVFSGFGGSLMSCLNRLPSISVGASGALFGLLGAMLSELITNWTTYERKCGALVTLVFVICLNMAVGFLPRVDNSAHIGGFLTGFFLGFILLMRPQYGYESRKSMPRGYEMARVKPKYNCYQYCLWFTALLILILGYLSALLLLYSNYVQLVDQATK